MGLFDTLKKKLIPDPVPTNPVTFEIAGLFAYEAEAKAVMGENPKLKKARKREGSKIFVLSPFDGNCEIIPEPDNQHDKNALKVVVNGQHIGYVPQYMQEQTVKRLKAGQFAVVKLLGGNYRMYEDGEWITYKNSIKGTVTIS